MHSFELSKNIIRPKEKIRLSITTLPDGQKQAISFNAKKINEIQPSFNIKLSEHTEKIIIVLRKKSIFGSEPIIASTYMKTKDFTIFNGEMKDKKKIRLFESVHQDKIKRSIVGHMKIEFTIHEKSFGQNNNNYNVKQYYNNEYEKINLKKVENCDL